MIPIKLRLLGVGPYKDEIIEFSGFTGDVTAITGANGEGKTFLFDSVFAALYRYFPSRGNVYEYCHGKAQISLDFKVGLVNYRSVLNIDPKKREMEPWLFCNGEAITDGKNSTFDNEAKRICGADKVVLTSTFSSQNKAGSFGEISKADRKSLFISMLGQEKLQKVSDIASSMEAASSEKYNQVTGLVEGYRVVADTRVEDLENLRNSLELARADISRHESSVKEKQSLVIDLKGKVLSTSDLEGRKFTLLKRKQACDKDISDTERALEEAKKLTGKLEDLKKASVKHEEITKQQEERQEKISSLLVEQSEFHQRFTAYKDVIHAMETELHSKTELYKRSQNDLLRATNDSKLISTVPCKAADDFAKCQFLTNAIKSRDSIEELGEAIVACQAQALALEDKIKGTPKPDSEVLASIEKRILDLKKELRAGSDALSALSFSSDKLNKAENAFSVLYDLQPRITRLHGELEDVKGELESLESSLKIAKESEAKLRKAEADLDLESDSLEGSRNQFNQVLASLSKAETQAEAVGRAKDEIAKLQVQLASLDQDRKSYNLLARAFGKTGIQSLEIDAAGPTISEITNDLLFSCFGPRFSVRFVTQILKDDKKGWKDEFDVYVSDAKSGREGSIDDLSGGEQTLVSEALSLAISLFNKSRSNVGWESLWRDEASSALDDDKAPRYLAMLRKARELGHFDRLFFISHQGRVNSGADSRLNVVDGKVSCE